jgi:hypothetical protein
MNYHWQGMGQEYVAMSDRYILFTNVLAGMLKKKYPDKDYYVLQMAYGNSRPAPAVARPADNVIVPHVSHFPWKEERRDFQKAEWRGWKKMGASKMMYRPNTGSPAGWQQGLPEVLSQKIIEDFRFLGDIGYVGIFIDGVWEHWSNYHPQYNLMAQLVWNPKADGNAILADYYKRCYGPAARDMKAYWDTFERARDKFVKQSSSFSGLFNFDKMYTPALLTRTGNLLKAAEARVKGDPVYEKRLAFVRLGFDYTELLVDNIKLMKGYKKTRDKAVAEKVKANWEKIMKIFEKGEKVAFNWGWLRPRTPRMVGLHPDHLTKKKKKNDHLTKKKKKKKKAAKLNTGLDRD